MWKHFQPGEDPSIGSSPCLWNHRKPSFPALISIPTESVLQVRSESRWRGRISPYWWSPRAPVVTRDGHVCTRGLASVGTRGSWSGSTVGVIRSDRLFRKIFFIQKDLISHSFEDHGEDKQWISTHSHMTGLEPRLSWSSAAASKCLICCCSL